MLLASPQSSDPKVTIEIPIRSVLLFPIRVLRIPEGKLHSILARGKAEMARPATVYVTPKVRIYCGKIGPTTPNPNITAIVEAHRKMSSFFTTASSTPLFVVASSNRFLLG